MIKREWRGLASARERQPVLFGDKGMIFDTPDALRCTAKNRCNLIRRNQAVSNTVNINQWLKPVHAPARYAFYIGPSVSESLSHTVRPTGERHGIIGNPGLHSASTKAASFAVSSRA